MSGLLLLSFLSHHEDPTLFKYYTKKNDKQPDTETGPSNVLANEDAYGNELNVFFVIWSEWDSISAKDWFQSQTQDQIHRKQFGVGFVILSACAV